MRVRSEFRLEYVFQAFEDIKEYQPEKHNPALIQFAQQVYTLYALVRCGSHRSTGLPQDSLLCNQPSANT